MKKYDLESFFLPDVPYLKAALLQYGALIESLYPEIWTHFVHLHSQSLKNFMLDSNFSCNDLQVGNFFLIVNNIQ
jgi:hypothetical protein